MVDVVADLMALAEAIRPFITQLGIAVGGVFGLYFLLLFVRIHYERKKVRLLEEIRYNLDQANRDRGIPYSRHKKGFFTRLYVALRETLDDRKVRKHYRKK